MRRLITTCAAVVMLLSTYASADIMYATGTAGAQYLESASGTIGTEFIVKQNLTLTKLGIWDEDGDGLSVSHDVGLFATNGDLLASVTIGAGTGSQLAGGYRWENVAPVALVVGTQYVLGAFYSSGGDLFRDSATINSAFTLEKDLHLDGLSLAMPTDRYFPDGSGKGWYGPNLQAVPVPVPAAVLIGLLGLGTAGLKLRKHV